MDRARGRTGAGTAKLDSSNDEEPHVYSFSPISSNEVSRVSVIIDTGASVHICNDRQRFSSFSPDANIFIKNADGSVFKASGIGTMEIRPDDPVNGPSVWHADNAVYIPSAPTNILSWDLCRERGTQVDFLRLLAFRNGHTVAALSRVNRHVFIECPIRSQVRWQDSQSSLTASAIFESLPGSVTHAG